MARPPNRPALWPWLLVSAGPLVLGLLYFTVPIGVFGPEHPQFSWTVFVAALTVLAVVLLSQVRLVVMQSDRGRPALVIAAVSALALFIFSATYVSLSRQPGEFNGLHTRLDALYFTVVTMATVGYGDITPTGQASRIVVILQIGYTLVFLAAGFTALSQQLRSRVGHRMADRDHRK
ncbi:potassium channel family protein [Kitasatospora sp. NPDC058965]|uniref:potassium channel family protein n=1 Tax=Kitasatospora sp. NPDC058965 TaxID=3346682 RepID=UPI00368289D7